VRRRILPSVKFKRKSSNILILSELTKLETNSEVEVSKKGGGGVPYLEDKRMKYVRKKPRPIVTVGYGKEHGS
jgi:hypothetical protein